jgi:hypothetical protein
MIVVRDSEAGRAGVANRIGSYENRLGKNTSAAIKIKHQKPIQEKIAEFMDCGCQLAWLIDPILKKTTVYQADGQEVEVPFDQALSGGNVLPGFEVILADLFQ